MTRLTETAPITKSIIANRTIEDAFRIFTEEIGTWWPVAKYSLSEERAETTVIEPRVAGRLYERTRGGEELVWGVILVWDPPRRRVHTWHVGRETATEVEVTFTAEENGTRVQLEHRYWERHGAEAAALRASYDGGWDVVLGRYAEATGAGARSGT